MLFQNLKLKTNIKTEEQYMVNIKEVKVGKDNTPNYNGALVYNRIAGGDARA